jgi:hypothetical protein
MRNHEHERGIDEARHRREIPQGVEARTLVKVRIHGDDPLMHDDERMPVGRASRHRLGADVAARARFILHQYSLPERGSKLLRHPTRADVHRASRRRRSDDAHGLRRVALLSSGGCGERGGAEREDDPKNAGHGHLPLAASTARGARPRKMQPLAV